MIRLYQNFRCNYGKYSDGPICEFNTGSGFTLSIFLFSTEKTQFNPFTTVAMKKKHIPEKRKKKAFFDLLRGNKKGTLGRNGLIGKFLCKTEGIRF